MEQKRGEGKQRFKKRGGKLDQGVAALKRGCSNPLTNYGQKDGQLIHRTLLATAEGTIIIIIKITISKKSSLYLKSFEI